MERINPYIYVGMMYVPTKKNKKKKIESHVKKISLYDINVKLEKLLFVVCDKLGVNVEDAKGTIRDAEIVRARQIYCYMAKEMGYTFKKIGAIINRDHATVIYACKVVSNRKFDFRILADYNKVIDNI